MRSILLQLTKTFKNSQRWLPDEKIGVWVLRQDICSTAFARLPLRKNAQRRRSKIHLRYMWKRNPFLRRLQRSHEHAQRIQSDSVRSVWQEIWSSPQFESAHATSHRRKATLLRGMRKEFFSERIFVAAYENPFREQIFGLCVLRWDVC